MDYSKKFTRIIIFIVIQSFCLIIFNASTYVTKHRSVVDSVPEYWNGILNIIIFVIAVIGIKLIQDLYYLMHQQFKKTIIEQDLENERQLNSYISMQKHDFRNHLMMLRGLLALERYQDASEYLNHVCTDLNAQHLRGRTSLPIIDAFLYAKSIEAREKGIDLSIEISSDLEDISICGAVLCRIIGNLLDNAFYAVAKEEEKSVELDIYEEEDSLFFCVYNKGPSIPTEILSHIFNSGFTTKKAEGSGLGLYIVKELLHKYDGSIEVNNQEIGGVSFLAKMPYSK